MIQRTQYRNIYQVGFVALNAPTLTRLVHTIALSYSMRIPTRFNITKALSGMVSGRQNTDQRLLGPNPTRPL